MSVGETKGTGSGFEVPDRTPARWWRPVATVVVFSVMPFAIFLGDNGAAAVVDGGLVVGALLLLLPGLALVALTGRRASVRAAERAAVVFAVATFLLFKFAAAGDYLEALGQPATARATSVAWALVFIAAIALSWALARRPIAWSYTLVAGLLLTVVPGIQYARAERTVNAEMRSSSARPHPAADLHAGEGGPDVYFFLLDGYGRSDQLQRLLAYDNSAFLDALVGRGFSVAQSAVTPYPMTLASVSSTLSLDYTVGEGELWDGRDDLYAKARGDNTAVRSFKRLGYDYAHSTDYEGFGCTGQEDICVEPAPRGLGGRLDEQDWALLDATPLGTLLPRLGLARDGWSDGSGILGPYDVVRSIERSHTARPVFAYIHLMTPHPPFRYREDCSLREPSGSSLDDWGDLRENGDGYADTVRCTNRVLLKAADRILQRDEDSVIVMAGDHGSGFDIDFEWPLAEWSDSDLEQRYSILNAVKLPDRCDSHAPQSSVNTLRTVLACVTREQLQPLPARFFFANYNHRSRIEALPEARVERLDAGP